MCMCMLVCFKMDKDHAGEKIVAGKTRKERKEKNPTHSRLDTSPCLFVR
jgi:hypothetical protein